MLKLLRGKLDRAAASRRSYNLPDGTSRSASQLIALVDEALGEWAKLDDLILQEKQQRSRIASKATDFVEFFVAINGLLLLDERKPRPKRTAAQKVLVAAKIRETRKLRGTLGKRQKQKIKADADGLTVTVGGPTPGIKLPGPRRGR